MHRYGNSALDLAAAFWRDRQGTVVRDYAVAVVLAAGVVILVMTLFADDLYRAYVDVFGP
jgi:hypothetical protein